MTYERFKEIVMEEGITNEEFILPLWGGRPGDDLNEDALRETCKWFVNESRISSRVYKGTGLGNRNRPTPRGGNSCLGYVAVRGTSIK